MYFLGDTPMLKAQVIVN